MRLYKIDKVFENINELSINNMIITTIQWQNLYQEFLSKREFHHPRLKEVGVIASRYLLTITVECRL